MTNAHDLLCCLQQFEKSGDLRGRILAMAFLIEAYMLSGYHPTPILDVISRAETLLESAPKEPYHHESAMLWFQMGIAMTVSCGNPRKAFWCCKKASLVAKQYGDINLEFSALSHAVEALAWLGEFEMADKIVEELESKMEAFSYQELRAYHMIALATFSALRGEIDNAKQKMRQAYDLVEKHGLIYWYGSALAADLFINVHSGELDRAMVLAEQMHDLASSFSNRTIEGLSLLAKGQISYRRHKWEEARDYLEKSMARLSSDKSLMLYHYHAAVQLHSRILLKLARTSEAVAELQQTIAYLGGIPDYLNLTEAHLCMAFIRHKQRKIDSAVCHLQKAFCLARQRKYYQTAVLSREDLADACVMVLSLDAGPAKRYASHLLRTHLADLSELRLKKLERHFNHNVQIEAKALRKRIYRQRLPAIRIQSFGAFKMWRGDEPIADAEWPRVQPKLLLKAIIARGALRVPREKLIEDLWPDSDFHAGEKNFKVTLHRLRKALEPGLNKAYGSSYVHFKENQVSLDNRLLKSDVGRFLRFTKRGVEQESRQDMKAAVQHFTRALDLYAGDFLADDPYLPFTEFPRIELRNTYIDVLLRLAALYEKRGKAKTAIKFYRRVMKAEPCMEEACQKLLCLFDSCGMRTVAVETYHAFAETLEKHLQCEPDQVTQAIYRKIANA